MKHYKPTYFIGQAFRGIWRNGVMSFASIAVLMSCLVVLGSFTLLVLNINVNLDNLGLMNEILVCLESDLDEDEIRSIEMRIRNVTYVEKVEHITPDEALTSMIEQAESMNNGAGAIYENYRDDNPLPDSFIVTPKSSDKVMDISYNIKMIEGVRTVNDRRDLANMMQSLKNGIMLIFSWFLIVLFIVSVFVIINTVKLSVYSRKNEIGIMRYVGATGAFISLPFIFEGALIGLVASVLAFIVQNVLYNYIESAISDLVAFLHVYSFSEVSLYVFLGFIGVGVLTGIVGSTISLSKYTRN